jgi:5'-nucleotidase
MRKNTMKNALRTLGVIAISALAVPAFALNILLTNDDGYFEQIDDPANAGEEINGTNLAPGLEAMKQALVARGHTVTIVAPLNPQSGKGGGQSTDFGASIDVVQQTPGGWTVDSLPSDCIRAAFGLGNNPEGGIVTRANTDLVISGINSGQNLSITGTQASGTINAALAALHHDVPAIAISAGRFSPESKTFDAMPAAADYIARMVDRLDFYRYGGHLIPQGTMLNVNWPVFYEDGRLQPRSIAKFANLASASNFEFQWGGDPTGGSMTVGLDFGQINPPATADPVPNNDTDWFRDDYVTISTLDGDMTVRNKSRFDSNIIQWFLTGLPICDGACFPPAT